MPLRDHDNDPGERIPILLVGIAGGTEAAVRAALAGRAYGAFDVRAIPALPDDAAAVRCTAVRAAVVGATGEVRVDEARIQAVAAALPDAAVLVIGPAASDGVALAAIRAGAEDYLVEQTASIAALPRILSYAVERRAMSARVRRLSAQRRGVETLLSTAFELSATPMAMSETDGTIVIVNNAFADLFGWSVRMAAGKRLGHDALAGLGDPATVQPGPHRLQRADGTDVGVAVRRAVTALDDRSVVVWAFVPAANPAPNEASGASGAGLAALVGDGPRKLTAGRVQIVSVDEIREKFGARWERWAERVYDLAERTIRKRLADADVVTRSGDGTFLICFATLDEQAAWFKAKALQREITRQLLGEEGDDSLGRVVIETHEIEIAPEEAGCATDITTLIAAKLTREAERLRAEQQRILIDLYGRARLEMRRVATASGAQAPILVADFDWDTRMVLDRLRIASGDDSRLVAEIDAMLLGRVAAALPSLLGRRPELLIVTTLHASTLQMRQLRDRFYGICRQLPDTYRRALILRVAGLPIDILPGRAAELLSPLRAMSRFRILVLRRPDLGGLPLRDCGVSLVEADWTMLAGVADSDPARVEKLQADLRLQRTHLVVSGLPDQRSAARAAQFGARFVAFEPAAGAAVAEVELAPA
ncbi:MAG: PAS domain-containing protein [Alphaproteobacteria bacterium]